MAGFSGFPLPSDTSLPISQRSPLDNLSTQLFSQNNQATTSLLSMMRFMQAQRNAELAAQNRMIDQQLKMARLRQAAFKERYGYTQKEQQANIALEKQNNAALELANNQDFRNMWGQLNGASTVRRQEILSNLYNSFIKPITESGPYAGADPVAIRNSLLGPDQTKLAEDKKAINDVGFLDQTWDRLRRSTNSAIGTLQNLLPGSDPNKISEEVERENKAITEANPALLESERRSAEGAGFFGQGNLGSRIIGELPAMAPYMAAAGLGAKAGAAVGTSIFPGAGSLAGTVLGALGGLILSSPIAGSQGSLDYSARVLNSNMPDAQKQQALSNDSARNQAIFGSVAAGAIPSLLPVGRVMGRNFLWRHGNNSVAQAYRQAPTEYVRNTVLQNAERAAFGEQLTRGMPERMVRSGVAAAPGMAAMAGASTYTGNLAYNNAVPEEYRIDPSTGVADAAIGGGFTGLVLGATGGIRPALTPERAAAFRARYHRDGYERESLSAIAKDAQAAGKEADPVPFVERLYTSYSDIGPAIIDRFAETAKLSPEEINVWKTLFSSSAKPGGARERYEKLQELARKKQQKGQSVTPAEQKAVDTAKAAAEVEEQKNNQTPAQFDAEAVYNDFVQRSSDPTQIDLKNSINEVHNLVRAVRENPNLQPFTADIPQRLQDGTAEGIAISHIMQAVDDIRTKPFVAEMYDRLSQEDVLARNKNTANITADALFKSVEDAFKQKYPNVDITTEDYAAAGQLINKIFKATKDKNIKVIPNLLKEINNIIKQRVKNNAANQSVSPDDSTGTKSTDDGSNSPDSTVETPPNVLSKVTPTSSSKTTGGGSGDSQSTGNGRPPSQNLGENQSNSGDPKSAGINQSGSEAGPSGDNNSSGEKPATIVRKKNDARKRGANNAQQPKSSGSEQQTDSNTVIENMASSLNSVRDQLTQLSATDIAELSKAANYSLRETATMSSEDKLNNLIDTAVFNTAYMDYLFKKTTRDGLNKIVDERQLFGKRINTAYTFTQADYYKWVSNYYKSKSAKLPDNLMPQSVFEYITDYDPATDTFNAKSIDVVRKNWDKFVSGGKQQKEAAQNKKPSDTVCSS